MGYSGSIWVNFGLILEKLQVGCGQFWVCFDQFCVCLFLRFGFGRFWSGWVNFGSVWVKLEQVVSVWFGLGMFGSDWVSFGPVWLCLGKLWISLGLFGSD